MHEARVYDLWVNGTRPGMRWQVRWDERDPVTGRLRRPGRKFPTEAKANTFAKVVNEKMDAGSAAPSTDGKALFAEVATAWQRSRREVKASHRDRAARELRTWVLPRFGNREVGSIRRREVQQFAFDLLDGTAIGNYTTGSGRARAPLAPTSVRSIVGQVRGVLAYAIEDEVMTTANPVTGIRVGKIEKTKTKFLTFAEVERLRNLAVAASGHPLRTSRHGSALNHRRLQRVATRHRRGHDALLPARSRPACSGLSLVVRSNLALVTITAVHVPLGVVTSAGLFVVGIAFMFFCTRRYRRTFEQSWIVLSITAALLVLLSTAALITYAVRILQ
jgi:hypothetical protein